MNIRCGDVDDKTPLQETKECRCLSKPEHNCKCNNNSTIDIKLALKVRIAHKN